MAGSPVDAFLADLSLVYARDCLDATCDPGRYEFRCAYVSPGGAWCFPDDLGAEAIAAAIPMAPARALARVASMGVDLMVPQMFCIPGMTAYRSVFDVLGIPFIGSPGAVMALAAHKARATAVVAAAGVRVPRGELLAAGGVPTLAPPVVVKPAASDNSLGVSLVTDPAMIAGAVSDALGHGDQVVVEEFVPAGREVRAGCIEVDGRLMALPLEEYPIDARTAPIRTHDAKIGRGPGGGLRLVAKAPSRSWIVPAADPVNDVVADAARACHHAIGARHYSLFDFRIDPQGRPWFLEASPYCSFARASVLVAMAAAAGIPVDRLFADMVRAALAA